MGGFDDLFADALSKKMAEAVEVECSNCGQKMLAMPDEKNPLCWDCDEEEDEESE